MKELTTVFLFVSSFMRLLSLQAWFKYVLLLFKKRTVRIEQKTNINTSVEYFSCRLTQILVKNKHQAVFCFLQKVALCA